MNSKSIDEMRRYRQDMNDIILGKDNDSHKSKNNFNIVCFSCFENFAGYSVF